ncbi:MAG TPA: hypothetical protein VJK02_10555 [Anaerolineales bacterium]|nr:hypothetical protein [Anaerolineales bacterium]
MTAMSGGRENLPQAAASGAGIKCNVSGWLNNWTHCCQVLR